MPSDHLTARACLHPFFLGHALLSRWTSKEVGATPEYNADTLTHLCLCRSGGRPGDIERVTGHAG